MARLSPGTKITYIGLWGLADDAGFLDWNLSTIAAALYRYTPASRREAMVSGHLATLVEEGRLEILECGRHGRIPTIPEHRIKGGEQLFTVQKRHAERCSVGLHSQTAGDQAAGLLRTTESYVSESYTSSVSDSESSRARGAKAPKTTKSSEPMSPTRAETILDDPDASAEAKAGARGYLELRRQFGRPEPAKREAIA